MIDSGLLVVESIEIAEPNATKRYETTEEGLFNENSTDTSVSDDRIDSNDECRSTLVAHTSHMTARKVDLAAEAGNESISNGNGNPEQCVDSVFAVPAARVLKEEEDEMSSKPDTDLNSSTEQMLDAKEVVPMMPIAEVIETCDENIESSCSKVDEDYLNTASRDMGVIEEESDDIEQAHDVEKTWFQNIFLCCRGQEEVHKEGVIG